MDVCLSACVLYVCVREVHRLRFRFRRVQRPRALIYVRSLEGSREIVTLPPHLITILLLLFCFIITNIGTNIVLRKSRNQDYS